MTMNTRAGEELYKVFQDAYTIAHKFNVNDPAHLLSIVHLIMQNQYSIDTP